LTQNPLRPDAHNQKSQICLNNLTEVNSAQIDRVDSMRITAQGERRTAALEENESWKFYRVRQGIV